MIGSTISHYAPKAHPSPTDGWRAPLADKILEKHGESGMGVVYKVPIRLDLTNEVMLSPSVGLRFPTFYVGTQRSFL